jgi:exonuclease III
MLPHHNLRVCSFNCRSVKSSINEIQSLCDSNDIVCLQEHWLLPNELNVLSNIHIEFLAAGTSAVDISKELLVGRPYGGTAILYRNTISEYITVLDTKDSRLTGIMVQSLLGPILLLNVYMPTNNGDQECLENYIDTCSRISAIFTECDANNLIVIGDFNCEPNSRFYTHFERLSLDNKLRLTDISRLNGDVFTYCSDSGLNRTWTDHILCNSAVDSLVSSVCIQYEMISSDHKPLVICFDNILRDTKPNIGMERFDTSQSSPDWNNASETQLYNYKLHLNDALRNVDIPAVLFLENACSDIVNGAIDSYYNDVIQCIRNATVADIAMRTVRNSDYNIPGWNDYVEDKHLIAREAFLEWVYLGKPRQGAAYMYMNRTRAAFKLALRFCKQHEDHKRADACAQSLCDKDFKRFWKSISKISNSKATKYAECVGGAIGESNVTNMWLKHFSEMYNSVGDSATKTVFYDRIASIDSLQSSHFSVQDVTNAILRQKKGKAIGCDGIAMEAIQHGGIRLATHISLLFNFFLKFSYLPAELMHSVIIPLVKCKSGDLGDVNNYRAIAISTAMSKVFETLLLRIFVSDSENDVYQFGFKKGHSTSLCTSALKKRLIITLIVVVMYSLVLLI